MPTPEATVEEDDFEQAANLQEEGEADAAEDIPYSSLKMQFKEEGKRQKFEEFLIPHRCWTTLIAGVISVMLGLMSLLDLGGLTTPAVLIPSLLLLANGTLGVFALLAWPSMVAVRAGAVSLAMLMVFVVVSCWAVVAFALENHEIDEIPHATLNVYTVLVALTSLGGAVAHVMPSVGLLFELLLLVMLLVISSTSARECSALAYVGCIVVVSMHSAAVYFGLQANIDRFVSAHQLKRFKKEHLKFRHHLKTESQKVDYVGQTLHDSGTPLAVVALAIEDLKTCCVSEELKESIKTCECAIELMTLTRRRAIDYAKHYRNDELRPRMGSTNVRELVETKCMRIISSFNTRKNVPISSSVNADIAKYIVTDGDFLWECLVNYLSNAVNFTDEGRIDLNVFKVTPDRLRFEVRDTGIGIPHDHKRQLFQPFVPLQKFAGGSGLGLWSVKKKVKALKGEVGVHDNPGGGAVFFLDIPYKPDFVLESAMEGMYETPDSSVGDGMIFPRMNQQKQRILLVAGKPKTHELADQLLGDQGFEVVHAINGVEGLVALQKGTFTAALLDYHVTAMGALQVLRTFRDWEQTQASRRSQSERQFICVMFPENLPPPVLNATINSGADCVWTDLMIPDSNDVLLMLEDNMKSAAKGKGPPEIDPAAPQPHVKALGTILLIEDKPSILKFEKRMFERHGYEVHTAMNGEKGLQCMKERMYTCVFTDIMMPVLDGYELVRRFREWEATEAQRRCPQLVYAVSANATEQNHQMAKMVGMDGFASKPVKVSELVELLEQHLETNPSRNTRVPNGDI